MSNASKTAAQLVREHFAGERDHYTTCAGFILEALETERDESRRLELARQRTVFLVIAKKAEEVLESMGAEQ